MRSKNYEIRLMMLFIEFIYLLSSKTKIKDCNKIKTENMINYIYM